jgi:hypothetical protein
LLKTVSVTMRHAGHGTSRDRTEMHTGFWWGNLKERDHTENLCENERCIHLVQDKDKWRALVKTVTNFRLPLMLD